MIDRAFELPPTVLLLHAEEIFGRRGVLVVLEGRLHTLDHSEVALRELLREAAPDDGVGVHLAAARALREDGLARGTDDVALLALVDRRARDLHADGTLQLLLELTQLGIAHRRILAARRAYGWELVDNDVNIPSCYICTSDRVHLSMEHT